MREIIISPSILAADYGHFRKDIKRAEQAGAQYLHIDVMDGTFVPNISFGQGLVRALRPDSHAVFDVHLMIEEPIRYVEEFADAGADIITIHVEAAQDPAETLRAIKRCGKKAGITLKPQTSISALIPYLDEMDMVLIMSVHPGFGGQKFLPESLERIRKVRSLLGDRPVDIEVDGGITLDNVAEVAKCGANVIVAGTCVFGAADIGVAIHSLKENAGA